MPKCKHVLGGHVDANSSPPTIFLPSKYFHLMIKMHNVTTSKIMEHKFMSSKCNARTSLCWPMHSKVHGKYLK